MNRVIKFRAWNGSQMICPYSVRDNKACIIRRANRDDKVLRDNKGVNYYCNWDIDVCTDYPLMQFTGIANIYESDIIEDHNGIGVVEYVEMYAAFRVKYFNGQAKWFYDYNLKGERDSINVIGNIYQNPELLK